MGCCMSLEPLWFSARDTDGYTHTELGVTDSSCLSLRLIYTLGCLALITSVMYRICRRGEERNVFNCDSSDGHPHQPRLYTTTIGGTGQQGTDDRSRLMWVREVHVSYKSSVPISPPLSRWITSSCVEGNGKAAGERHCYLICGPERCLWSISRRKCLSESRFRMSDGSSRTTQRVSHCDEGVVSGNVLSCSLSSSKRCLPQTFLIQFASDILFTCAILLAWL